MLYSTPDKTIPQTPDPLSGSFAMKAEPEALTGCNGIIRASPAGKVRPKQEVGSLGCGNSRFFKVNGMAAWKDTQRR